MERDIVAERVFKISMQNCAETVCRSDTVHHAFLASNGFIVRVVAPMKIKEGNSAE